MTSAPARYAHLDVETTELVDRLVALATRGLPEMYREDRDEFAFTRVFTRSGAGISAELSGTSLRYAAIVALGAAWLPAGSRPAVLGGHKLDDFVALLVKRQATSTNLGDIALIAWAAAQIGHPLLADALQRLRDFDRRSAPEYVVEAAWVVSALASAREQADVEEYLTVARDRLLGSVAPGSPVFPHATGAGLVKPYRDHVACFADQVYPIQALARLHQSGDDAVALAAARRTGEQICRLQGPDGQWWWHYDARTGGLIEGYPVYAVHQHAMAPMALLDLAEAGGGDYDDAIRLGLRWMTAPAELGADAEPLILDDEGLTVRKVFRGDPGKIVRGVRGVTTRAVKGARVGLLDRVYRPTALDRECRPYEFGWLYFAWLSSLRSPAPAADERTETGSTGR
jgi:hypothetical protein